MFHLQTRQTHVHRFLVDATIEENVQRVANRRAAGTSNYVAAASVAVPYKSKVKDEGLTIK